MYQIRFWGEERNDGTSEESSDEKRGWTSEKETCKREKKGKERIKATRKKSVSSSSLLEDFTLAEKNRTKVWR